MKVEIMRAVPEDADMLIQVCDQSFYKDYQKYGRCPGYHISVERMLNSIENHRTYKVVVEGQIIGSVSVRVNGEGDYYLRMLCVIPAFENKGIGQMILDFLDKEFPDGKYWTLKTPADKQRNHYFYKKHGYQVTKEYMEGNVLVSFFERWIK